MCTVPGQLLKYTHHNITFSGNQTIIMGANKKLHDNSTLMALWSHSPILKWLQNYQLKNWESSNTICIIKLFYLLLWKKSFFYNIWLSTPNMHTQLPMWKHKVVLFSFDIYLLLQFDSAVWDGFPCWKSDFLINTCLSLYGPMTKETQEELEDKD